MLIKFEKVVPVHVIFINFIKILQVYKIYYYLPIIN